MQEAIFKISILYLLWKWFLACVSQIYSFINKNVCFWSLFFVKIATVFKLLVILFIIKLICCFKNDKNLVNTRKSQKLVLWLVPFVQSKKYLTSKVQRSYLSWHWRVMQNLKQDWLVVWKITWGSWQIFPRAFESLKIGTLMGSFCPK